MRDEFSTSLVTVQNGGILGQFALLPNGPSLFTAVVTQASIVMVARRHAFIELIQREPLIGVVVYRNLALELAGRVRSTNASFACAER